MKKMKKLAAAAAAGAIAAGMLAGCGGSSASSDDSGSGIRYGNAGGTYTIGYVNQSDTDVFNMERQAAFDELFEGTEYTIMYTDGNDDNQKQVTQANTFLEMGVDILILVPSDSEAIVSAVNAANAADVPVICFGVKASSGDFTFVGSDDYEAGYMQGEYMAEVLEEGAQILYAAGTSGLDHSTQRREGFKDALADNGRDDVVILDDQDCNYVKNKATETCNAWIQLYSDGKGGVRFDAIVCANDQMALGCVESLMDAGILTDAGEVLISGIDGTDEAIQAVADGYMVQTVLQDAEGQAEAAFEIIQEMMAGESVESEVIIPFQSITADNVADFQ